MQDYSRENSGQVKNGTYPSLLCHSVFKFIKQAEIAAWTGVNGNGSIHDGNGTIGHGLTMDIAKGLSVFMSIRGG